MAVISCMREMSKMVTLEEMEKELDSLGTCEDASDIFAEDYVRMSPYNEYRKHWYFSNGWGISVIRGMGTYGVREGLFEIALLKGEDLAYVSGDFEDVIGWLKPEQVIEYARKIYAMGKAVEGVGIE